MVQPLKRQLLYFSLFRSDAEQPAGWAGGLCPEAQPFQSKIKHQCAPRARAAQGIWASWPWVLHAPSRLHSQQAAAGDKTSSHGGRMAGWRASGSKMVSI